MNNAKSLLNNLGHSSMFVCGNRVIFYKDIRVRGLGLVRGSGGRCEPLRKGICLLIVVIQDQLLVARKWLYLRLTSDPGH